MRTAYFDQIVGGPEQHICSNNPSYVQGPSWAHYRIFKESGCLEFKQFEIMECTNVFLSALFVGGSEQKRLSHLNSSTNLTTCAIQFVGALKKTYPGPSLGPCGILKEDKPSILLAAPEKAL